MRTAFIASFPSKLCFAPPVFTEVRTTDRQRFQILYCQEHCWLFRKLLWGTVCL